MDTKELKLDLETVEQVADMLWLSSYIEKSKVEEVKTVEPKPQEKTPEDNDNPKTITKNKKKPKEKVLPTEGEKEASVYENDASTTKTDIKADPIRMPKKLSLSHYRAWEKSFRSFYYKVDSTREFVLDEAKTVDIIAKTKLVQPIFKAKKVKYFHLVMVIEQSPSMDIWSELILEFQKTVQRFGVFESIEFYYLASDKEGVNLYADRALKRELSYKKITLNRQVLLTVVSDCVSSAWHSNHIFKMLEFWSKSVPVSITQMFPKRMWQGTSLYKGFQTSFTAHDFQPLNKQLKSDDDYYDEEDNTFNIPIVNFEPQSVTAWASVIHGKRDKWIDGVTLEDLEEETFVEMSGNKETVSVEDRVNRYLSQASPLAQKLALYASVLPINFHVIRVLQELKLPESSQIHLAEFFLGGLIKREVNEKKQVSFDFHDGVRDYFRNQLTATAAYRLQELMSNFVSQNLNSSLDFQALIDNPNSTSGLFLSKDEVAFVKLRADTLRKLGGDYGRQADRMMKSVVKGISIHIGVDKFSKEHYGDVPEITTNVQDALDMQSILDSEGYSSSLLLNEEATIEAVNEALISASKELTSGDILVISYSGEMILIDDKKNDEVKVATWVLYNQKLLESEIVSILTLFKKNVRILILSDSPLAISSSLNYENIMANVKLISPRSEGEHGYGIPNAKNSIFITEFKKVWNNGEFRGTIDDFFEKTKKKVLLIAKELRIYQTPILSTFGEESEMFNRQELFSISGVEARNNQEIEISSIVLITDNISNYFGTGFSIYNDESGSYILTTTQIVDEVSIENIKINDFDVSIYSIDSTGVTYLAILYVKGLFIVPLELETNKLSSRDVYTIGYKAFKLERNQNKVNGKIIGDKISIIASEGTSNNLGIWKISGAIHKEYIGGPLISKESGKVIGIVSHRERNSNFYAVSIDYLKNRIDEKSILPFQKLIPLEFLKSDFYFSNKKMTDAVVMVSNNENKSFWTGFVIHQDDGGSYVVTTKNITDRVENIIVAGYKNIELVNVNEIFNLAIFYVSGLYSEPLILENNNFTNREVEVLSYLPFTSMENRKEILEAKIVSNFLNIIDTEDTSYKAWKIVAYEGYEFNQATSGAPILSKESGKVIGIVNNRQGSNTGYAIYIQYLQELITDKRLSAFKNLTSFNLDINNLYFNKGHMHKSIVIISSKDTSNKSFGTGFVVHQDGGGSYIITANFVIESTVESIINYKYNVEVIRSNEMFELAILYVRDFYEEAFSLQDEDFSSREVETMGYSAFHKNKYQQEAIAGQVISDSLIVTDGKSKSYKGWEIIFDKQSSFNKGVGGAPLVSKETNRIIGVFTNRKKSTIGYAVSIEHLKEVWDDK